MKFPLSVIVLLSPVFNLSDPTIYFTFFFLVVEPTERILFDTSTSWQLHPHSGGKTELLHRLPLS